ncbi:MAG: ATP-binding protein, partial [bacterium]
SSLSALQREIPHSLHQLKNLEQFPLSIYQSLRSFYAMEKDLKDRRQEIECKRNEIKLRAEHTQRNFEEISFPESFQQILEEIWGLLQELFQVEERVNKKRNEKEMWEKERQYIERKFQEIHEVLNMDVEKWFSILNQMQKNMQAIESQKEECIGKIERLTKQTEQHSRPPTMILHLAVISLICCILLALDIFFWKMLFLVFSLFFWKGVLLALSLLCISLFIWYFYGENQRRKLIKHIQEEIKKEMERKSSLEESLGRVNLEFAQYQWKEKTGKVRLILGLENIQTGEGAKNGIEKEREDILQKMREMEKKKEKISEMLSRLAEEEKREMEAEEELVREISGLLPAHHPFPENHSFPFLMNWWKNLSREYEEWLRYKQLSDEGERLSMALEGVARHISQLLAESGFSSWEEFEAGEREYRRYQKLKEVLQQNQKVLARLEHIAVFRWNQPLKENGGVKLETELIETSKRLQEEIDKEEKHLKELNEELSRLPEIPSMAEIEEEIGEEESRREQWKRKEGVMRKSKELLEAVHQRWEKDFPPQFLHYLHQLLRDSGWMNAQIPWSEPLLNTSLFQSFSHSERTIYSVAFRLAFLLAIPVEASIPLILDDAFAFLTQEQKEKVFAVLSGMGQRLQILYFTGRKEDLALAQKYFPSGRVFCLSSVQG